MPTSARSSTPLFFSRISCARRIKVRSTSEADMSCAFCWISTGRPGTREFINAASYACGKMRARPSLKPAPVVIKLHAGVARPREQRGQRAANRGEHHGENHSKKEGDRQPRRGEQVVDAGLNVRVGRVCSEPLSDFQDVIGVFLLGMKNKNPDGDQQRVDG